MKYEFDIETINRLKEEKILTRDCFDVDVDKITELVIPEGVEGFSTSLFEDCVNLKEVKLPSTLKKIVRDAFKGCTSLEKIEIPEGVEELSASLFEDCVNLKEVKLPSTLKKIEYDIFKGCTSLEKIEIPEGVEELSASLFEDCVNLKEVKLPSTLKKISVSVFDGCSGLERIEIPEGVEEFGSEIFYWCLNLKELILPSTLKEIGDGAFGFCASLERIEIPEGVEMISRNTFQRYINLKEVVLPSTLKEIGTYVFEECTSLEKIEIPEGVEELGYGAFSMCTNLKEVILPSTLKKIEYNIFKGCRSLERIEIPEGVGEINPEVFAGCDSLKEVIIPSTVKKIENSAFKGCTSLERIEISEGVKKIHSKAFAGCANLKEIRIPMSSYYLEFFVDMDSIKSLTIEDGKFLVLGEEVKRNQNSCNIFKYFKNLDMSLLLKHYDKLPEIINKVNRLPENTIIPGSLVNDYKTFEKLLDSDYTQMKNLINLIPEAEREVCLPELYKLAKAMGVLEKPEVTVKVNGKEIPVRDVAYTVLQGAIKKNILDTSKIHANFSSFPFGNYNEQFLKFMADKTKLTELMNQEEVHQGFTSRVYSWFEDRRNMVIDGENNDVSMPTSEENRYKIMSYEETENGVDRLKWKNPTVELLLKEFASKKFTGINTKREQELAEYLARFNAYNQKHFDKAKEIDEERIRSGVADHLTKEKVETTIVESIDDYRRRTGALQGGILDEAKDTLKTQKDIADKIFTYEMLAKSDPANFAMGLLTSCCATLYGAGAGAQRAMIVDPNMQPLVIRDSKGNIVCFGIIYVNKEEGYAVVNDFELNRKYENSEDYIRKEIYTKAMQGVDHFVKQYNKENADKPINIVTCGISPNWTAINDYLRENPQSSILKAPDLSEFKYNGDGYWAGDWHKEQRVIWENNKKEGSKR